MPNCDFHKAALQFCWNHTSAWMFPCKFATYFQHIFYWEHLWMAASVYFKKVVSFACLLLLNDPFWLWYYLLQFLFAVPRYIFFWINGEAMYLHMRSCLVVAIWLVIVLISAITFCFWFYFFINFLLFEIY